MSLRRLLGNSQIESETPSAQGEDIFLDIRFAEYKEGQKLQIYFLNHKVQAIESILADKPAALSLLSQLNALSGSPWSPVINYEDYLQHQLMQKILQPSQPQN